MFSSSVSSGDVGGHFGDIGQLGESVDRLLVESGIETSSVGCREEQSPLEIVEWIGFYWKQRWNVVNRP